MSHLGRIIRHALSFGLALGFAALSFACTDGVQGATCGQCADPGARRCGADGVETCIDDGGCLRWSEPVGCAAGGICSAGVCEVGAGGKEDSAASLDTDGDGVLRIDAIFETEGGKAYFFLADEYLRYDLTADRADPGYPKKIAAGWPGVFERDLDAAVRIGKDDVYFFKGSEVQRYDLRRDRVVGAPEPISQAWPGLWEEGVHAALNPGQGKLYFFRDTEYLRWDVASHAVDPGYPKTIEEGWPGNWAYDIDAALWVASTGKVYFFSWNQYLRYDWATDEAEDGYPLERTFHWPGLWDIDEGTGRPGARLPDDVAAALRTRPTDAEIAARRARVAASAGSSYEDLTPRYPQWMRSVEDRLGAYGCGLLRLKGSQTHRFRCATDTRGALRLDIAPLGIDSIDWQGGAYHVDQVSQGDFLAGPGTPLSVFGVDDGVFYIHSITANNPTGSISAGLNIKVRFAIDGAEKIWGFSHLDTMVPGYVLDALADGTPLTEGTVFGFIGYTGNLWVAPPPATDGAYQGNGRGLPAAHTHIWFATGQGKDDPDCHKGLAPWARKALDFSSTYPFGGG